MGSSPRMRGALEDGVGGLLGDGIIPADAGSTPARPEAQRVAEDHPRGCGEHICLTYVPILMTGSSPRMRGAQGICRIQRIELGIIPADAGSTCW